MRMKLLDIRVEQFVMDMMCPLNDVGVMLVSSINFGYMYSTYHLIVLLFSIPTGEKSICSDKQLSGLGKGVQDEWFNSNLYWSLDACDSNETVNTGNDLFLPSTRLTSKDLPTEYGGGGFNSTSPEGCQTECYVRCDDVVTRHYRDFILSIFHKNK